jgi:hypothetical protein
MSSVGISPTVSATLRLKQINKYTEICPGGLSVFQVNGPESGGTRPILGNSHSRSTSTLKCFYILIKLTGSDRLSHVNIYVDFEGLTKL